MSHCAKIVFLQKFGDVKKEVFEKKLAFFVFFVSYVGEIETDKKTKQKWKRPKKTIKIVFFSGGHPKCEKCKERIFGRNCLTLFVSGREKKGVFRAHYLFVKKKNLGPKQCKPGNTIKIVVSAESAQNQKWHLFFEKSVFDMGEKVGFTVFLKNCVF